MLYNYKKYSCINIDVKIYEYKYILYYYTIILALERGVFSRWSPLGETGDNAGTPGLLSWLGVVPPMATVSAVAVLVST